MKRNLHGMEIGTGLDGNPFTRYGRTIEKRSYVRKAKLKTATYLNQYRCHVCRQIIRAGQRYFDGGHGFRVHKDCV